MHGGIVDTKDIYNIRRREAFIKSCTVNLSSQLILTARSLVETCDLPLTSFEKMKIINVSCGQRYLLICKSPKSQCRIPRINSNSHNENKFKQHNESIRHSSPDPLCGYISHPLCKKYNRTNFRVTFTTHPTVIVM